MLLQKANELRALFVLGQRVIPFLEEIFIFVSEIQPLLDEINHSIQENLKKMPSASKQLSKVTEATEMATTEIMDIVDGVVYKTEIIKQNFYKAVDINATMRQNPIKLLETIYLAIQSGKDLKPILPKLATAIDSMKKVPANDIDKIISETDVLIQSISIDASSIMISLQVQDITAQQIAAVNNMLETIQLKLGTILNHFQSSEISELVIKDPSYDDKIKVSQLHRKIAFDPDAVESIANKQIRQQQVDDVFNNHVDLDNDTDQIVNDAFEEASQDDIDALFNQSAQIEEIQESNKKIDIVSPESIEKNDDDPFEHFSQDDIDALFGK